MELALFSVSDTALFAEALSALLLSEPWVASSRWQVGIDPLPELDDASPPDVVLVMCSADVRPDWIRCMVRLTSARVVAVGVNSTDDDVLQCAEAGACGYLFCDQSIFELRQVLQAAVRGEVLCSPRVAATLLRRVSSLAVERQPESRLTRLTPRECQILKLIDAGRSNKEIASGLVIDLCTVKNHVHHIIEKLEVGRRGEAAAVLHS